MMREKDLIEQAEKAVTLLEKIVIIVKNIFEIFKSDKQNKVKKNE